MLKFVYCVRRRPGLSREEFHKYWLEQHGPLVRKYAHSLRARRYVQSHTLDTPLNDAAQQPRGTQPPYDGVTEIWWDKPEDLMAALSSPEGQKINQLLAEDEARFCDLPNCSLFFTEEHAIFDLPTTVCRPMDSGLHEAERGDFAEQASTGGDLSRLAP